MGKEASPLPSDMNKDEYGARSGQSSAAVMSFRLKWVPAVCLAIDRFPKSIFRGHLHLTTWITWQGTYDYFGPGQHDGTAGQLRPSWCCDECRTDQSSDEGFHFSDQGGKKGREAPKY
jgi:hypothetical protein